MWLLPPYFRARGGRRGAFFRQTRRFPARRYYTLVFFILNIWIPRIVVPLARKTGFGTTFSRICSPFGSKNRVWDYKTYGSSRIKCHIFRQKSPKMRQRSSFCQQKRGRLQGTLHKFNKTVLSASLGNDFLGTILGYLDDSGEVLLAGEVGGHFLDEDEVDRGVGGVHSGDT